MQGWRRGGSPNCWESTAPTPVVDASTSTMNGAWGSGWRIDGAMLKADLSPSKALWELEFQDSDLGLPLSMEVNGAVCRLKSLMKRR